MNMIKSIHCYIQISGAVYYGGCDYGGFYGECDYGECEYGGCDYGGWYGLLVRAWVTVWIRIRA